jgi:hypothetical protein
MRVGLHFGQCGDSYGAHHTRNTEQQPRAQTQAGRSAGTPTAAVTVVVAAVAVDAEGGIGRDRGDSFPGFGMLMSSVGHGVARHRRDFRIFVRVRTAVGILGMCRITTPLQQSAAPAPGRRIATLIGATRVGGSLRQSTLVLEEDAEVAGSFGVAPLFRMAEGNCGAG